VRPGALRPAFRERLAGVEQLLAPPVTVFKENERTQVARLDAAGLVETPVFIKVYRRQDWPRALRDFWCGSRATRAVRRAQWLDQAGIPVVRLVAAGRPRWAWWTECAVISAAVLRARPLREYLWTGPAVRCRRRVLGEYAALLAQVHAARLSHGDPSAHNVLVTDALELVLVDVDGLKRWWWWPRRWAVRELRHVLARAAVTRRDELWMLAQYARHRGWPVRGLIQRVGRPR
jgi:hypothetical protein